MGREIRRVPEGWEHPRHTEEDTPYYLRDRIGTYRPLYDQSFREAMAVWWEEYQAWERGERPCYFDVTNYPDGIEFCEWHGPPPDPQYHRPDWPEDICTHFQLYETVSEGTPLSPPMPSPDALADWLATHKDFWGKGPLTPEQAGAFCRVGWAPSFVISPETGVVSGIEAVAAMETRATP